MLLRIQTVFLALATALSSILFIKPYAGMLMSDGTHTMLTFMGLKTTHEPIILLNSTIPLTGLAIITALLSFITIFFFGNRKLQLRLCVFNILLTLGFILALCGYYLAFKKGLGLAEDIYTVDTKLRFALIIPFVNIFLIFQAFRAIRRDDLLIKSMDRLR